MSETDKNESITLIIHLLIVATAGHAESKVHFSDAGLSVMHPVDPGSLEQVRLFPGGREVLVEIVQLHKVVSVCSSLSLPIIARLAVTSGIAIVVCVGP